VVHEKPARHLVDQRGRRCTRWRAGFSCATLYLQLTSLQMDDRT